MRTRRRLLHDGLTAAAVAIFTATGCTGQQSKIPRLGFVSPLPDDLDQLIQALRAIRYVEGQNIAIESRLPGEDPPLLAQAVDEVVRLAVDIIVIAGTPAAQAAKLATRTIPVVFHGVGDAVASGLIANLARPEGNVTGVTNFAPHVIAKGLEYLVQLAPGVARIAFVGNLGGNPGSVLQLAAAQAAAVAIGVEIVAFELRDVGEIDQIFESFSGRGVKALMVGSDAKTKAGTVRLVELAARYKVPAVYNRREFADAGGLIGFGPRYPELWKRVADLVDKILHGKTPADLPVEQPKAFDLVVNLRTAEKSGIPVPQAIIAQATEVIR